MDNTVKNPLKVEKLTGWKKSLYVYESTKSKKLQAKPSTNTYNNQHRLLIIIIHRTITGLWPTGR